MIYLLLKILLLLKPQMQLHKQQQHQLLLIYHLEDCQEGSAFMVGRTMTAMLWGVVADLYGRKPVMILSTLSIVIFNTMFGLSINYWMALTSRMLLGAFCGSLGPMRAYATEVSRREHQALGVAMMSTSWGVGLVIGPTLGGYLAQPADKFPSVFSQESIFGRFPYLLASLVISAAFAFGVFILCFCLLAKWKW